MVPGTGNMWVLPDKQGMKNLEPEPEVGKNFQI